MIEEYFKLLFEQFCSAREFHGITKESKLEFRDWLNHYKIILKYYLQYLEYLDDDVYEKAILEVNKGPYDSACLLLDNAIPVSPYFDNEFQHLVFVGENPQILTKEKRLITPDTDIFMTHNPYNLTRDLTHWDSIHNEGAYDILVGMFGLLTDKDRLVKLQALDELRQMLANNVSFDYDTFNENYFAVLKSNRYVRKLVKTRC